MVTSPTSSPLQQAYTTPLQQKVNTQSRDQQPKAEQNAPQPQDQAANTPQAANTVNNAEPALGEFQQFTLDSDGAGLAQQQTEQERGSLLDVTV